jgi:hypothetical protein
MKNILFREAGYPDKVFVQCLDCKSFVASYEIAPLGYYHHGKGYESFLRGITRSGEFTSGRNIKNIFVERRDQEIEKFNRVLELLREKLAREEGEQK